MKKLNFKSRLNLVSFVFLSLFFSGLLVLSCSDNNSIETEDIESIAELKFNAEKFSLLRRENSENEVSDKVKMVTNKTSKEENLEDLIITNSGVNEENLNDLFLSLPESMDVLVVTEVTNTDGKNVGLLIHSVDKSGKLRLNGFERVPNTDSYHKVEFPAEIVNGYKLDNILFLSQNLFPNNNLSTLAINTIDEFSYGYDDMKLLAFTAKHKLGLATKKSINPLHENLTFVVGIPCSMAAHQCRNGTELATECHPTGGGCRVPTCPRSSAAVSMEVSNLNDEAVTLNQNLPTDQLYELRDELNSTAAGSFYTDAYYATSSHFEQSLELDMLIDIAVKSPEIGEAVSAFLSEDQDYTFTEEEYNLIVEILQESSGNSESALYKDVIQDLIQETSTFKNKDVTEIKTILDTPRH